MTKELEYLKECLAEATTLEDLKWNLNRLYDEQDEEDAANDFLQYIAINSDNYTALVNALRAAKYFWWLEDCIQPVIDAIVTLRGGDPELHLHDEDKELIQEYTPHGDILEINQYGFKTVDFFKEPTVYKAASGNFSDEEIKELIDILKD